MEHGEWVRFGLRHLREARAATRVDLYKAIDGFRGLSPYDQHAWYLASKGMINALFWAYDTIPGPGLDPDGETASPGDFADRLAAHRALAEVMIRDLDRYAEDYQREHDVKGPPEPLETVRARVTAFRETVRHVIDQAPGGIFRRS